MKSITISIDDNVYEAIDLMSEKFAISKQKVLRIALDEEGINRVLNILKKQENVNCFEALKELKAMPSPKKPSKEVVESLKKQEQKPTTTHESKGGAPEAKAFEVKSPISTSENKPSDDELNDDYYEDEQEPEEIEVEDIEKEGNFQDKGTYNKGWRMG